jgi:hypothetical protein
MKRKSRRNPSVAEGYKKVKSGIHKVQHALGTLDRVEGHIHSGISRAGEASARAAQSVHAASKSAGRTLNMISLLGYSISAFIVYTIGKGFYAAYRLKMGTAEMKAAVATIKTGSITDVMTSALQATGLKSMITPADQKAAIAAINAKLGINAGNTPLTGLTTFNKNDPAQVAAMKIKLGYTAVPRTQAEFKANIAILDKIKAM